MHFYTYMTIDVESNKFYVGRHSTIDLFDGYIGSGKWIKNYPLEKSYRIVNYVLEFFNDPESLKIGEQKLLNEYFGQELCMNFSDKATGFATGNNNPTNNLTPEQIEKRSLEHWSKTDKGKLWFSENNPSKKDSVKAQRSAKAIELWLDDEYRSQFTGDNHWVNQDSEAAKKFKSGLNDRNNLRKIKSLENKTQKANIIKIKDDERKEKKRLKDLVRLEKINSIILTPISSLEELTSEHRKELSRHAFSIATSNKMKIMNDRRNVGLNSYTEEELEKMRKPKPKGECPHCKIKAAFHILSRYHNDNCKQLKQMPT